MNDLDAFGSAGQQEERTDSDTAEATLVLITQGPLTLGIEAHCVESVVPWQPPALLPQTSPWVMGVIQDRGKLVAVRKPEIETKQLTRVVLCSTSKGLIGIPASETRSIGVVRLKGELRYGVPLDSDQGALTLFDAEALAAQMTGE